VTPRTFDDRCRAAGPRALHIPSIGPPARGLKRGAGGVFRVAGDS
jgi:hypothetical protein